MTDADRQEIDSRSSYEAEVLAAKLSPSLRKHTWLSSVTSSTIIGLFVYLGCRAQISILSQDINARFEQIERSLPAHVQTNQQQVILQRDKTREETIAERMAFYASNKRKDGK